MYQSPFISCRVVKLQQLTTSIYQVFLEPLVPFSFYAGQYLQIELTEDESAFFSIASSPNDSLLELHIGAHQLDDMSQKIIQLLSTKSTVEAKIGLGSAYWRDASQPSVIICGGTGYSYARSIMQWLIDKPTAQSLSVFWGAKTPEQLYDIKTCYDWQKESEYHHFYPIVEHGDKEWQGILGYVHQAAITTIDDLVTCNIYLAGPINMIKAAYIDLIAVGVPKEQIFGDALSYIMDVK